MSSEDQIRTGSRSAAVKVDFGVPAQRLSMVIDTSETIALITKRGFNIGDNVRLIQPRAPWRYLRRSQPALVACRTFETSSAGGSTSAARSISATARAASRASSLQIAQV